MAELLVFGSIAYDCIETPIAKEDYILGGSASYAALAASLFHYKELEIVDLKQYLKDKDVPVRL